MTDDLSAILAEMAERERLVAMGHVRDPQDVPRLLALARAVLKLADDAVPVDRDYGGEPIWWNLTPEEIRSAVLAALTGKGKADG